MGEPAKFHGRPYRYILVDHSAVPVSSEDWYIWMDAAENTPGALHVADDTIDGVRVSTVFLGVDLGVLRESDDVVLFETMIFGGEHGGYQERTSTWAEAEAAHARAIAMVRSARNPS